MNGTGTLLLPPATFPFTGREKERDSLVQALESAKSGAGNTLVIEGPTGIGKTRLAEWLDEKATELGFNVEWGRCFKESMEILFPWIQVFGKHAGIAGASSPSQQELPSPASTGEPLTRVMMGYLERLEELSRKQPQLIILDDVQWADPPSMKMFQFISRNVRDQRVVLVSTLRSDVANQVAVGPRMGEGSNMLDVIMAEMERDGCLKHMVLQGLEAAHLQQIAERMAGAPIVVTGDAGEIGDFLHRAEGNPYYVISTLQVLSDRGRLKMQESKAMVDFSGDEEDGERLSLPRTIRHAVRERLSMFPEPETEFLVASAVLGQEFSLDIVAAALGWPRQEAERAASTLENARVLRRCPGPDQGLRSFANSVTWEAAYSLAPPGKHMVFARSLAKWYVRNAPESLETIARLYHDAGEADEGLPWVRKAMELALRSGTPEMVARLHSWLQEFLSKSGTPPDERVREGLEIVDRLDDLHGESWTLPSILEKLRKLHPSPALAQLVGFRLVRALTSLDLDRAQTNLDLLLSSSVTPAEAGSKDAIVSLIMAKSSLMIHKGNYAGVVEEARKGLPHLEHDGASRDHIHLLYMMQISLAAMGNLEAAAELNREFKPLTENSDCGFFRYLGMVQEAFLANVSGDFARAGELYGKGAMLANAIGRTFNEVSCLYNSGITAVSIGDAPTANSMLGKASRVARRFGHTEWMGCLIYLEGEILLCEQKWAQAASHIRHAIQGGAKSNLGEELPHAQLALAEALFHSGDIDGSRKWLKEVASGSNKTQFESLPRFYRVSAQVEEFGGNVEGARELLHSSIETAAKVGNYLERGKSRWELAEVEGKHGGQTGGEALRAEATADFDRCHLPERFRPAHPHDPTS